MIKLDNITIWPFRALSLRIRKGRLYKILAESDFEKNLFIYIILGMIKPETGSVFLFGKDLWSVEKDEMLRLFRRVGMVPENGGLISNLKVGENIILPVWYHDRQRPQDAYKRVSAVFAKLGFGSVEIGEYMSRSPGSLSDHEKRIVALMRAMLMEPELMIYDALVEGLEPEMMKKILDITNEFHIEKHNRTSIFISSKEQSLKNVLADETMKLSGGGLSG